MVVAATGLSPIRGAGARAAAIESTGPSSDIAVFGVRVRSISGTGLRS
jgi:hypothetical protein